MRVYLLTVVLWLSYGYICYLYDRFAIRDEGGAAAEGGTSS